MEEKKSRQADLERRRGLRWLIGACIALILFLGALQIPTMSGGFDIDESLLDEIAEEMEFLPDFEQPDLLLPEEQEAQQTDYLTANVNLVEETKQEEQPEETPEVIDKEQLPPTPLPPTPQAVDENEAPLPTDMVEQLPEFPGGMSRFVTWLSHNLHYPEPAREQKVQGRVIVSFIVNKDGTIADAKVARSASPLLDEEAMRVIRTMPKWKPGTQDGKPCRTMFTIPIIFKL